MVIYMTKTTKKEMFNFLIEIVKESDKDCKDTMVEFIQNEITVLDKKQENKKLTKTQEANELIKTDLITALAIAEQGATISQLQELTEFSEYSNQKLSALLNQLVKENKAYKEVGADRKTVFKVN